jgi:hypothetical protein
VATVRKIRGLTSFTLALLACGSLGSGAVLAQNVDQTLDKIDVSAPKTVLGVKQTPVQTAIRYQLGDTTNADFKTCQGTGTRGLYCLDGNTVVRFPNPDEAFVSGSREVLADCTQLGLQNCTAMAVDLAGNIALAGQTANALTHSILRLRKRPTAGCGNLTPVPQTNAELQRYCIAPLATGRQFVRELQAIDGAAGANFTFGAGFLTLEGAVDPLNPVVGQPWFYRGGSTPTPPTELGRWNLGNGETLSSVTLLQYGTVPSARNFIVAATSTGRVLSGLVPASGTNYRVGATNLTLTPNRSCVSPTTPVPYRTRASVRTKTTYFTRGCDTVGYKSTLASNGTSFTFASTPALIQSNTSTVLPQPAFLANGVSVSPGIEFDFAPGGDGCDTGDADVDNGNVAPTAGCELLTNGDTNGVSAARLSGVKIAGSASDWTMFQVKNLPDCRYLPVPRTGLCSFGATVDEAGAPIGAVVYGTEAMNPLTGLVEPLPAALVGTYVPDNVRGDPTRQYLNITPLLPPEVTQATFLPERMLLGPKFRARETLSGRTQKYRFDALFGIPEDGLQYQGTFQLTTDIADLLGIPQDATRCVGGQLLNPKLPPPWDLVVNVSEIVPTVGGPFAQPHSENVGWLQNGEYCVNPSASVGVRGSAFMYGLELAPNKEVTGPSGAYWYWPDSTYALLMRSLAKDLDDHIYTYMCPATGFGFSPFSDPAICDQLLKDWVVTYPKLSKCVDATDKPKGSAGNEACQGFESQFAPFKAYVDGLASSPDTDPDNRIGELKARVAVLSATYVKRFTPSIKDGGFTDPNL